MNKFSLDEIYKIKAICDKSFRGNTLSKEETLFVQKMFHKNDEEYGKITEAVISGIREELDALYHFLPDEEVTT